MAIDRPPRPTRRSARNGNRASQRPRFHVLQAVARERDGPHHRRRPGLKHHLYEPGVRRDAARVRVALALQGRRDHGPARSTSSTSFPNDSGSFLPTPRICRIAPKSSLVPKSSISTCRRYTTIGRIYLGPMVNWERITEKVHFQREQQRLQQMVEQASVRLILADSDFKIIYMNPASIRTLKQIEHLLPCKVDEILGKPIDIFHKNPEYQRRFLSNPDNLPHRGRDQAGR